MSKTLRKNIKLSFIHYFSKVGARTTKVSCTEQIANLEPAVNRQPGLRRGTRRVVLPRLKNKHNEQPHERARK